MAKFEFNTQKVELEICGKKYTIDSDYNTSKLCEDIQKKAKGMFEKLSKDENSISKDEICKFFLENIDKLLGEGSTTMIFMGREKNYVDAAHLFNFIMSEMNASWRMSLDILGG